MKKLLCLLSLLTFSVLAFGQAANIPVCNGSNGPNCTDYFGVGNWANSPLPAGTITGYTLIAGGSGYTAPTVTVTDPTGAILSGPSAPIPIVVSGVITGFTGGTGGAGYTAPVITITDVNGSGALASAMLGPPFVGGIHKFVDPLKGLPLAVPDTKTFPGSDFYVIELTQYAQQMHSDLPPTTLRGYHQTNNGTDAQGNNSVPPPSQSYLGPVILAQKDRPVRVLFKNMLPTGQGGSLFIPVDTTYMGAGPPYAQNRATLHLHGGATPWISDGTPHQWTTPAGEGGPARGDSTAFVPDMWFDAVGNVIPGCAGQPTCAVQGATNDSGAGTMTFFWTNQQGGRLMFYHDHAYGITRLNVYAGEAAGYLLYDPAEESALLNATAPGTIATNAGQGAPDLAHLIPLVIQDKSFVPSAAQLAAQDPTWAVNFGASQVSASAQGNGDLWFPHIYMPNQNPNDPFGASGFGRWDYGPWFFPPQTSLTAGPITTACTSSAFPGQSMGPTQACPTCGCPITPNPSGTPESFMDTPVVNGVAYPKLSVAPAAYRFQILSAGNDRSFNLSWFIADSSGTEIAMLPAAPPTTGSLLPLCPAVNPVAVPPLVLGLVTGLLDGLGNPINGTGLPAGCWPNFGPQPGIPVPQTMWAADGRSGGAPDPRNAGPAWIQIGTEGGLLATPVVIPPTPVNYEQNVRSITVGSVAMHGLWLGPAERADVIVDFSQFAGKTLILYNDAPAPAPASDARLDYFTGDGDQSMVGGAPNTPPGYGPNTRTIMQVYVDPNINNPNSQAFSLTALKGAFASTSTTQGVFAKTQPTTIVPEPAYNSAYNASFPPTYASIQSTTLTFNPITALTFDQSCGTNCAVMGQKTIQELFTLDYGRMNATLGTELPNVNFLNQTTIPLGYVDPATEIIKQGNTQLWKITHNGVDTHFIHFHLFNVQVVNRVGWDGSVRPIDANEAGWKDTVRMNPLEDILVALQPIPQFLPFPLPNRVRLLDVTAVPGSTGSQFTNVNPFDNTPFTTTNNLQNFGWEYVWHCHILGHEENDMMRPIIFQVPPAAPSNLVAASINGQVNLTWTDNSASETGFTIQRDLDPAFPNPTTLVPVGASNPKNAAGEGTSWGGVIQTSDNPGNGTYYYRAQAVDNGWAGSMSQTWNASILGSLVSGWSNIAAVGPAPSASVNPTSLTFADQLVNTTSTGQTVFLSNASGAGALAISGMTFTGLNPGDFSQTNNCGTSLPGGGVCSILVAFRPTATGSRAATLNIASSNPTPLSVSVTGNGTAPVISPSGNAFLFGSITVGTTTTPQNLTLTNAGTAPLAINSIVLSGGNASDFAQTNNCPASLATQASCTVSMTFTPTATGNRSTVLVVSSSDPVTPLLNISLSGVGQQSIAAVSPAALTFPLQLVNTTSAVQTVTLSNTGNSAYSISSIGIVGTNAVDFVLNYNCPIGGVGLAGGASCAITLTFTPTAAGARTATVNIVTTANVNKTPTVGLSGLGTQVNLSTLSLTFAPQVIGSNSTAQSVTLTNTGPAALGITSIGFTGTNAGDFNLASNNCPASLASGRSCRATVRFRPTAVGVRTAALTITTNDPGTPVANVTLTGTGIQAAVSLTPTSHAFGIVTRGGSSQPFPFTLTNLGTAALTINRVSIGGANGNQFSQTNNCGARLAIGASCTINVTFSPRQRGSFSATLQVTDNAPNSPQTAALTGTGQ